MKKILFKILKIFSSLVLKKYKPEIIAITGSIGKTSSKEAIFSVLKNKFKVRTSFSNFNNELGVPLTILGIKNAPGKFIFNWFYIFIKFLFLITFKIKKYPQKLILEMGADHPGDIEYFTKFIPVNIGVLTKVSKVHIEFFNSLDEIFKEKRKIFSNMPKGSWAILNNDDEMIAKLKDELKYNVLTYGIKNESDIWATDLQMLRKGDVIGMNFKIRHNGNVVPVFLPDSLGMAQVYAFLSAVAVGIVEGLNLVEISILAKNYTSPKGRTHLLKAINDAYIIDDTYNSSPDATKLAIDLLSDVKTLVNGNEIVVLGDMLELGKDTKDCHEDVGKYIAEKNIDFLFTIGKFAEDIYLGAIKNGFNPKNAKHFKDHVSLIKHLETIIEKDSIILVKGSQGARMEKVVKEIMKNPGYAKNVLVRQSDNWLDK